MPSTAAFNPGTVVIHEIPRCTAEVRIIRPSHWAPRPKGVFMTSEILFCAIKSTAE